LTAAAIAASTPASAFNDETHEFFTAKALAFMLEPTPQSAMVYSGGWSARKDSDLATRLKRSLPESKLKEIITYTADVDWLADVTFRLFENSWTDATRVPRSSPRKLAFTVFSHFLNVHRLGDLWNTNGYYYPWVALDEHCKALSQSNLANALIRYAHTTVVTDKTLPFVQYKSGLAGSPGDYAGNFAKEISEIRFWPATAMITHWYDQLLSSPITETRLPLRLHFLGAIAHIMQDMSVPFHAVGISGCGHDEFEAWFEAKIKANDIRDLYDPTIVRKHLRGSFLDHRQPIAKLALQVAGIASRHCRSTFSRESGESATTCRHLVEPAVDRVIARDTFNLAIAGTVVAIRKAIDEWKSTVDAAGLGAQGTLSRPTLDAGRALQPTGSAASTPSPEPHGSTTVTSPAPLARSYRILDFSNPAQVADLLLGRHASSSSDIRDSVGRAQQEVLSFLDGHTSQTDFERQLQDAGRRLAESAAFEQEPTPEDVSAIYPDSPPVFTDRVYSFRLPTLGETNNPHRWRTYLDERRKYTEAASLLHAAVTKSYLESRVESAQPEVARLEAMIQRRIEDNVPLGFRAIYFADDSHDLSAGATTVLDAQVAWAKRNWGKTIIIEGHADDRGTNEYNLALGQKRARAAMNYLVSQGMQASRITIVSYGEKKPSCLPGDEFCANKNRRVTFTWRK